MTRSFKAFAAAAVFVVTATAAIAQGGVDFASGMALVYSSGKTSMMQVAQGDRNHQSMMRHATKVPANTVFFMSGGQLWSTHGALDPTGNFYIN